MRNLLCEPCGARYKTGRYCLTPAGHEGPAEWVRVVRGVSRGPQSEQMKILHYSINASHKQTVVRTESFPTDHYSCDRCSGAIKPGYPAVAVSLWLPGTHLAEPEAWEGDYLDSCKEATENQAINGGKE